MTADAPAVRLDITGPVAWLTFSNPRRRNAITPSMCAMLVSAVEVIQASEEVRVVVVRGDGEEAFISGADITELSPNSNAVTGDLQGIHALIDVPVPVIAMINGACYGGGVAVALDADIRVASSRSRFAIPAARLGVGYGVSETESLVRAVGPGQASVIMFTGSAVDAATALRIGLVHEVVGPAELAGRVSEIAELIAANAPLTVRASKATIRHVLEQPASLASRVQVDELIAACWGSADVIEGQQAFLEKRSPTFRGR